MASFYRRGKTWSFSIDIGYDKDGKRKKKQVGGFRTKKEAEAAAAQMNVELNQGTFVDEKDISFRKFSEIWLKRYEQSGVKKGTVRIRKHEMDKLYHYFDGIKIKDITKIQYQDALLDLPFLTDYASTVGKPVLISSVDLFEKMMPDYMAVLDSNMIARDQAGVVEEAHKIKGAAGSIGLRRLQQTAQLIQSPDHPAWWENVEDWIETLRREYPGDITRLRRWLLS